MDIRRNSLSQFSFTTQQRVSLSVFVGVAGALLSYTLLRHRGFLASDFTWTWAAARYLLAGHNPYHNPAFALGRPYPFNTPLPYPLPAVFFSIPFAAFPVYVGGALFFGVSVGLLTYGASRYGWRYLPMFFSAPLFIAASVAQWSPLMVAGAFLPAALPILALKPNLGVAIFSAKPSLRAIPVTLLVTAISFLVVPNWVGGWLTALNVHYNPIPIDVLPYGPILLLAALAWRRPTGRLLLIMALMPQTPYFYDQLPLWLVPRSIRQGFILTASSWISYGGWWWIHRQEGMAAVHAAPPWITALIYFPALGIVLWQEYEAWKMKRLTLTPFPKAQLEA